MIQLIEMTDEEFRRQGIGTQTLIELEAKAHELELESLGLHSMNPNDYYGPPILQIMRTDRPF